MGTNERAKVNRENALKSTGPKTAEGKAVSSMNALRHGLTSALAVLVPDEDHGLYMIFAGSLEADLKPEGAMEEILVDRIVAAAWRLRRAYRVEAGVFTEEMEDESLNVFGRMTQGEDYKPTLGMAFIRDANDTNALTKLSRYETALERGLTSALHELQRLQALRAGRQVFPPVAVDLNVSAG